MSERQLYPGPPALLHIQHAAQIVAVSTDPSVAFKARKAQDEVEIIEDGTLVIGADGRVLFVGTDEEFYEYYPDGINADVTIDLKYKQCVLPGFVDGHTHPVWSGDRAHEFALKLAGATYLQVHQAGGGIQHTVSCTRKSSEAELQELLLGRLDRMLTFGTTTAEAKSGYGLDAVTEMKMLRVLHNVSSKRLHPVELSSTYCAHALPAGMTESEATADVLENHLPELKRLLASGEVTCENVDVFLDKGFFEMESSRKILAAGKEMGLAINFHGDELEFMHSGEIAGELEAMAVSHLERVDDAGIAAMAKKPTAAVLLPTTAYVLRLVVPPARKLIEGGVPVALGSDFCPNAHCMSMPAVMNLACVSMRMTMNEALVGATLNSAYSLNRGHTHGSLAPGKVGDIVILDAPRWEHVIYQMVDPPISRVFKGGEEVTVNRR